MFDKWRKRFKPNGATMPKRIMVQCSTRINKDSISRKNIDGVEHIIVSSTTLPDDVVMNGGLYPADEIAKSFHTLERTLAPIEHPCDANGNFLSAADPLAINNFYAGAYNVNVRQEGGRVHIDKEINVQEAMKTDRGKRLLDRVKEIETNDNPRSVHTSVGLFLEVEDTDGPQVNAAGDEFKWIARNMVFDHDAILLDNIGAATPEKGVGMAVNANGDKVEVQCVQLDPSDAPTRPATIDSRANAEGTSFAQISEQLQQAINGVVTADWIYLVDVFDGEAIFETSQGFFSVVWTMSMGRVEVAGLPIRVDKEVKYIPKVNSDGGNSIMKEKIVNALKEAGIETKDLTDDQLFKAHADMLVNQATEAATEAATAAAAAAGDTGTSDIAEAVTNAMKPIVEKIDALATKVNAADEAELNTLAEIVGNSDKHPGIDVEEAKALPLGTLKKMAASCADSYGIGSTQHNNDGDDGFTAPTDMTE